MPTQPLISFNSPSTTRLDPCYNPEDAEEQVVKLVDGTYARGQLLGELIGVNDVQTITINATGGTFTASVPTTPVGAGGTTAPVAWNASAAALEDALEAIPAVGEDNVAVTLNGLVYTITFQNALADLDIDSITTDPSLLTGGAGTAAVALVTDGDPGTPGTFAAYDNEATDGRNHARCILRYACVVAAGVLTGISDWGPNPVDAAPAFMRGYFRTDQLVGLDTQALIDLHGTIVMGNFVKGVVRIG